MFVVRKAATYMTLVGVVLLTCTLALDVFDLLHAAEAVPLLGSASAILESRPGSAFLVSATMTWAFFVISDDRKAIRSRGAKLA